MPDRNVSKLAHITVRVLLIANIAFGIGFALAVLLSFPFAEQIAARLVRKYGQALDVANVLLALRLLMALGVIAAVAVHRILAALLEILATVSSGDPFIAANAARLRTIGYALLVFQLLHLVQGGFTAWFAALNVEYPVWSPALGGWIAVLMAFVLASVFERGAAMRDDLAATI